jgi:hypothetical protein
MRIPLKKVLATFVASAAITAFSTAETYAQKIGRLAEPKPAVESNLSPEVAPEPILFDVTGNFTCADLNNLSPADPRYPSFAHMDANYEWKFDPPNGGGPFPMTSGLSGGLPSNSNLFMTYGVGPASQMNFFQLSWTSPQFLTVLVSAVIIKGGNGGAYVYPYPTLSAGDTGPFVLPTGQAISHISFCFNPFTAPSSSSASLAGRVLTSGGAPISGATVMIQNLNTGATSYLLTNSFGRYATKGLPVGDFYAVTVMHRRYIFDDATRYFTLEASLTDLDFISR